MNPKNKKPIYLALSSLLCLTLTPLFASAQSGTVFASPPSRNVFAAQVQRDLAEVLRDPRDDQHVILRGYLIEKLRGDKYLFVSGQARIRVEIDPKVQPSTAVTIQTQVEIEGEVEKDFLESPEIDVHRITVLD